MSTNLIGDTNDKRAAAQRPVTAPQVPITVQTEPQVPITVQTETPEPPETPVSTFDPFAPVDVSGLQSGTLPLVQTAGQTPLQVQEQVVAPLEKAGIADIVQSEATRLEESAQPQDTSILEYSPPDIDGQIQQGNERINSFLQQLDLQDRQRQAEAQSKYQGMSLADAMQQLDREPEQGSLERVFKQVGDYFGGAMFTDPRDGRQYTTPYVAKTQEALGLPVTQKDTLNVAGALLYGLNFIGAAPIAFAKDRLDDVNRVVHGVTQAIPWLKGSQQAYTDWFQRNAPALAAQAIKKRDERLKRPANSHMITMLRGGNYNFTQEMSTGSIGKIPGTNIDVDPGSLVGFAADVATGELVERGISAVIKQGLSVTSRVVRAKPKVPVPSTTQLPSPVKRQPQLGAPSATIPDNRAIVLRPSSRGTGRAMVPSNSTKPVVVQTIEAVPPPTVPTKPHRTSYRHPKPTGPAGQYELPLNGVVQIPVVPSLLDDTSIRPISVNTEQLVLPGVLPERKQFGMLGVEFHPDNTVVFKGIENMFEDGDVIEARAFFKELAEHGQAPSVKFTSDLDETTWDNGFINALHMGFKPVAADGSYLNPNLVEFGSDVTMRLAPQSVKRPRSASVLDADATLIEIPGTSASLLARADSILGSVPSPAARELYDTIDTVRSVYAAPYVRRDDMSLRTMVGALENVEKNVSSDLVAQYRLLRDSGERVEGVNKTRRKVFGDVELHVTHLANDTYEVGFVVDGRDTRVVGERNPVQAIAEMSKYVIDLHKANPEVRLVASIASKTDEEWAMKFRMYKRAGFVPVDEMNGVLNERIPPGTYVRMMFDPMSVESGVLARRLASTETSIPRPGADLDFVELSAAVQMKEALAVMRADADKVRNTMYENVLNLRSPSRMPVEELPRINVGFVEGLPNHTTKPTDYNYVYHGTRVQVDDISRLDHINGGSPSSIGIGLHITENVVHAEHHAMKAVNADLPPNVARTYGPPSISRFAITPDANILDANLQIPELAALVRQILTELAPDVVDDVPPILSVMSAIEFVDELLEGNTPLITLFQREFSDGLRKSGVDIVSAGPNARVVLNTDILYEEGLNTAVRGAIDSPLAATRYADLAAATDYKALRTERSIVDYVEAGFAHADQRVHEIANVQEEIARRVDNAVSQSTLWDYNGVPDPDSVPRYTPEPEPTLRNAATPFDTQTNDISPCTL